MSYMNWIISLLKKVWYWTVLSSNNPESVSLTVKSVLTYCVTIATMLLGLANVSFTGWPQVTVVVDATVAFVQSTLIWVSMVMGLAGAIRKLWTTIKGTNQVIATVFPKV